MPWELITKDLESAAPDGEPQSNFVGRLWRAFGLDRLLPGAPQQNSAAFTIALVSLSAKLAKSDGVASRIETETFERLHRIVHEERGNIRRMFELAASDMAGFESYAWEVARLLRNNGELMHDVLEGLFHIAASDGILHPEEERHLAMAAKIFGFSAAEFRALRGLFVHDPDDPYTILGVTPGVDDASLKTQYKRLVREHHPDHLIARGVPQEYINAATQKLAEINAAYDQVARERGL